MVLNAPSPHIGEEIMRESFEKAFGPTELSIVDSVFNEWLAESGVTKDMLGGRACRGGVD
ncbi:hypothetical protein ASC90_26855 [Rhizobium sp. Root1220]|nr:hypothetical protein ASC90_26855 [Rhizobium sp. Root1220]